MNDYRHFDWRDEPKEIVIARKFLEERIRHLKSELWDRERPLGSQFIKPSDEEILTVVELEKELSKLLTCDEILQYVGQGVDRIIESARKRSVEKLKELSSLDAKN
ncbi:MAG: hypothetical protein AB7O96_16015 [Pseudobdellovibrionaceae bacterium]